MPNYNTNNSVIYKIYCKDGSCDYVYYGSSISFTKRKCVHKSICNAVTHRSHNSKVYQIIRENGGWDNWKMCVVEIYPCESVTHLRIKEQEYIDLANNKCNTIRSFRSEEDKNEYHSEWNKLYYLNNDEKVKECCKKYYINNTEIINEKNRQYYKKNAEKIKEQKHNYRERIKEQNTTV